MHIPCLTKKIAMNRVLLLTILLVTVLVGCAEQPTTAVLAVDGDRAMQGDDVDAAVEELAESASYPEKQQVLQLMHRANSKFSAGRFEEALTLVNQALQVDPHSVVAIQLRQRITDLLLRS